MSELDKQAKALYDACPTVKPDWEQLGDRTRELWRERAAMMPPADPQPGDIL